MIEEALVSRLLSIAQISAEIGTRLYPLRLPQNVIYPAMSYQKVASPGVHSFQGRSGLYKPMFEVNIWCDIHSGGYAKVKEIGDYVRQALDGLHSVTVMGVLIRGVRLTGERDFFDEEPEVFRLSLDFSIWHDSDKAILS